eukprot:CAMPEP_0181322930 /NCGR_PEP_ID=MMETSP1101-20121128/19496_1 /TAXON_ID=46948 /ORGANISM="Rhodomonas abbreviata, Strain Caron Lab Isolate" /LENGTH=171 /DNA_ID=CAMNT_0023430887 /DNA_START=18 /DNA_END=533 /DNA_ORIENTATION=+
MAVITYGAVQDNVAPVAKGSSSTAVASLKVAGTILMGLMAAALVAAMVASSQNTPNEYKSELESYNKLQYTTMLDDPADGVDEDQAGDGYECCWHAPNPALASTSVASQVGPNGWGAKADADASVQHYENALGEVPEWVFTGTADHEWKDYDTTYNQDWYKNTYPSGESGI